MMICHSGPGSQFFIQYVVDQWLLGLQTAPNRVFWLPRTYDSVVLDRISIGPNHPLGVISAPRVAAVVTMPSRDAVPTVLRPQRPAARLCRTRPLDARSF
jgi:hypothetical protein